MPEQRGGKHTGLAVLAGFGLSAALLVLLFYTLPFDAERYKAVLLRSRGLGLVAILATTVLHLGITGLKWRYVTNLTSRGTDLGLGFYFYSALIGLFGQVLPLQVAIVTGRSLALRLHGNVPLRRGAGGAIYDQIFDLLVPLSMTVPIVLAALSMVSLAQGGMLALAAVALVGGIIVLGGEGAVTCIFQILFRVLPSSGKLNNALQALQHGLPLTKRRTLATIYALSTLRFANLVLRAWLVAWTLHLDISWPVVLFANCAVTFSLIVSFVPGALGVVEWGWVGMLHLFGVIPVEATQYALSSRLFALCALLAINLVHALLLMAYWGRRNLRDGAKSNA